MLDTAETTVLGRETRVLAFNVPLIAANSQVGVKETRRINLLFEREEPSVLLRTIERLLEVGFRHVALAGVGSRVRGRVAPGLHPVVGHVRAELGHIGEREAFFPIAYRDSEHSGVAPGRVHSVVGEGTGAASDAEANDLTAAVDDGLDGVYGRVELGGVDKVFAKRSLLDTASPSDPSSP